DTTCGRPQLPRCFLSTEPSTPDTSTLSLHDALPISPAQSSTPPSATASSTGQRKRSPELSDSSNVRMRDAVPASTTPAETHRSSRFFTESAMRGSPLAIYFSPAEHTGASCSGRALLIHDEHAGFGIIRRRHVVKRNMNIFALGLAVFYQYR